MNERSTGRDTLYKADIRDSDRKESARAMCEGMNHVNRYRPQLDLRLREVEITEEPEIRPTGAGAPGFLSAAATGGADILQPESATPSALVVVHVSTNWCLSRTA